MEFWSYPCNYSNSGAIVIRIGNLILSFQTLEFWPSFFSALEFWSYPSKHWISGPFFIHIGSKLWNSGRISISIGISILFFPTLQFLPYFCKHWNSDLILLKVGTLGLLSYTLAFWSYPSKRGNCGQIYKDWNSDLILQNIWILVLFL